MYCYSCGKDLVEGAKFCVSCGVSVDGSSSTPTPSSNSGFTNVVTAKSFKCDSCGTPLSIPKNNKGVVVCPSCKNESVIENLVKNAAMAAKENINSGISLTASPAILHRQLVNLFYKGDSMPTDIFDKAEVVLEQHYCVPSYSMYCSASAHYNYEIGRRVTRQESVVEGNKVVTKSVPDKEYNHITGTASISKTFFSSANKEFAEIINHFYLQEDTEKLVDYEYLEFPSDVIILDSNYPQDSSFKKYIIPSVEKELKYDAQSNLSGQDYRNLKIGGARTDKIETRVYLCIYHLVYKYNDKDYSLWASGDGERIFYEELPYDGRRDLEIKQIEDKLAVKQSKWKLIVSIVLILLGLTGMTENFFLILLAVLGGWLLYDSINKSKANKEARRIDQAKLNILKQEWTEAVNSFKTAQKPLKGIYETVVVDDSSAF